MFFKVKGAKHGPINAEAQDSTHKNEIEVLSWSWGMQGKGTLGGVGAATGRATMRELRIVKHVDKASTALMSALRTNEVIKEGILTLRKTGTSKVEYLKITIQDGRVMTLDVEAGDESGAATLRERVSFSFNKIAIEYTPQGGDGMPQGSTSFEDQWGETT